MEDTREAAEYQEEISSLIAGQLTDADLHDVEEEFAELIKGELPEVPIEQLPERESPKRERVPTKGTFFESFMVNLVRGAAEKESGLRSILIAYIYVHDM